MNLVEEKQKVGKQESTTSIKSILEKTLQREEIEIKYNCNPCNKLFNNKKDIQMHWHSNHQCALCQEIFTKNHQQFEEHLKKFHDMQKEHHQIFVDSIYFNKKNQKNIEKAEITHVKSMKKGNSTTCNDKRESECLSSNVKSIKKQNSTTSYISGKSKNQPKNKEKNVQSKKNFNNLDNNKIKIISLDVAKKVLQHLNEYDDSIKKQNSTTSNEKREFQCLSSKRCSPIEVDALKEYDDNIIEEQNSTTSCKKRKMERNLPSISINSQCQPRKDEEITQNLQ